jgi:hypothetical protein
VEQQLAAGLGEGQVAEFVEDDEVEAGEMIGNASLAAGAGFGLEFAREVDDVEEAAAGAATDAGARDGDGGVIAYRERKRILQPYAAFWRRLIRRLARTSGGTV